MTTPDGLLIVDKPAGWTSHDVVARARRLCDTRRVGHAGTLDPMATGVLVLGINRATKLLTFLVGADKTYTATIRLGQSTITDDADGEIETTHDVSALTAEAVQAGVAALTGQLAQVPSAVSAIKVDGQRSYARVRAGQEVVLPARAVTVSRFDILGLPGRSGGCRKRGRRMSASKRWSVVRRLHPRWPGTLGAALGSWWAHSQRCGYPRQEVRDRREARTRSLLSRSPARRRNTGDPRSPLPREPLLRRSRKLSESEATAISTASGSPPSSVTQPSRGSLTAPTDTWWRCSMKAVLCEARSRLRSVGFVKCPRAAMVRPLPDPPRLRPERGDAEQLRRRAQRTSLCCPQWSSMLPRGVPESVAVTFDPHPRAATYPERAPQMITSTRPTSRPPLGRGAGRRAGHGVHP